MDRIKQLQHSLKINRLNAVLITKPENVRYLCGFTGSNGRLLVTQSKATFITDFRYLRAARNLLPKEIKIFDQKNGLRHLIGRFRKMGVEDEHLTYSGYLSFKKNYPKLRLKPVSGIVEDMRMIKEEKEIRIIRKAVSIADKTFEKFVKSIKAGQSETEMEWNLLRVSHECGAEGFSFPPIIAIGMNSADVHHKNGSDELKKGDKIMIDFGIIFKGYCTDMTRVIFTQKPTSVEQKIYSIVLDANEKAIKSIKPEKNLADVDKAARDFISDTGYGDLFGHALGHGVGIEVHEQPRVSPHQSAGQAPKATTTVQPGMVFTIEPGIYSDKLGGGIRIEDMVYINRKGKTEVLTRNVTKKVRIIKLK